METLLTIDAQFNESKSDRSTFATREAARGVVVSENGEIFLLKVTSQNYHKLPGGGIDEGEDIKEALAREILEEIGCKAKIVGEVGQIIEYREYEKLKQISYCYLANQYGEQVPQTLEQGEIDEGHDIVKAKNIDDAISILEKDKPKNHEGNFIRLRDLTLLKASKRLM